jgi:putative oxidoreductase
MNKPASWLTRLQRLPMLWRWIEPPLNVLQPLLALLGLGGCIAPLGFSVVNGVAVLSLAEIAPAAMQKHISWGIVLTALAVFGTGRWALDRLLEPTSTR